MTRSIRFCATGLLLSSALLGFTITWPAWWEGIGIDWTPDDPPFGVLMAEPGPECEAVRKRITAKRQVIASLQAGDLTLFEAAAWFRLLNVGPPEYYAYLWEILPGDTEEQKLCHQVILWVENQKCGRPSDKEIDQTVARLEGELLIHLAEYGRVYLPGWQ